MKAKGWIAAGLIAAIAGIVVWYGVYDGEGAATQEQPGGEEVSAASDVALEGRVRTRSGEPIEGATVTAVGGNAEMSAETGAEGRFEFPDLAPGDYRLDATADDYVSPGPRDLRMVDVTVEKDATSEVALTLYEPATLAGRVVAGSESVSGADLTLYYLYADGLKEALDPFALQAVGQTDGEGRFELDGVAPGRLRILVEPRERSPGESSELYVKPGADKDGIVIDLAPSGSIGGLVKGEDSQSVKAEVVLSGPRLSGARRVRTGADGRFAFDELAAGSYDLKVRADGYRTERLENVEIERGGDVNETVKLQRAEGLFGRVVDGEGEGVKGAFVLLRTSGERVRRLRTNPKGEFQLKEAADKRWTVRAYSPGHVTSKQQAARPGEEVVLEVGEGGTIAGKVVSRSGPVSKYRIGVESAQIDGGQPYGNRAIGTDAVRDEEGRFDFGPLRPGTYRLRVKASGFASKVSEPVTVRSGDRSGPITIEIGRGTTVTGRVTAEESGEPLANASVALMAPMSPFDTRRVEVGDDGTYEIENVSSGRRSLRVSAPDYLPQVVGGLEVPGGGTMRRDITLQRKKPGQRFAFQGIGAVLMKQDDGVKVRRTMENTPAANAGLKRGDVIRAVGRELVDDESLSQIVEQIRGQGGEPVNLEIERNGRRMTLEIIRDRVIVNDSR